MWAAAGLTSGMVCCHYRRAAPRHPVRRVACAYYAVDLARTVQRAITAENGYDAYLYSPAFAQLTEPLASAPIRLASSSLWRVVAVLVLTWLAGPLTPAAILFPEGPGRLGNSTRAAINMPLVAGAIVAAGFRSPGRLGVALLHDEGEPARVALIWFAVRREWRSLRDRRGRLDESHRRGADSPSRRRHGSTGHASWPTEGSVLAVGPTGGRLMLGAAMAARCIALVAGRVGRSLATAGGSSPLAAFLALHVRRGGRRCRPLVGAVYASAGRHGDPERERAATWARAVHRHDGSSGRLRRCSRTRRRSSIAIVVLGIEQKVWWPVC